jgi:hypothetical protein
MQLAFFRDIAVHNASRVEIFLDHLPEFIGDHFRAFNVAAKRNCTLHRMRIGGDILFQIRLRKGLVAPDDLRRVIELQFAVCVRQTVLYTGRNDCLIYGKNDDLVVG